MPGIIGEPGFFPHSENHILLLEDEPSHCRRNGLKWKIMEVEVKNDEGTIVAKRVPKAGNGNKTEPQTMTFDSATRVWQGRESIRVSDLISQKVWPESGKREMKDQAVLLGITWKPAPGTDSAEPLPVFTSRTSGWTINRLNTPLISRPRKTIILSVPAGCLPM